LTNTSPPLSSQRLLPWRQILVHRLFRPVKEQQGTEVLRVQACHRCLWSTYTLPHDCSRGCQGGRQRLSPTSRIDLSHPAPPSLPPCRLISLPSSLALIRTPVFPTTRIRPSLLGRPETNLEVCFFSSLLLLQCGSTNHLFAPGYIHASAWPSAAWTTKIIKYIRKYDSNHLIIDGSLSSPFRGFIARRTDAPYLSQELAVRPSHPKHHFRVSLTVLFVFSRQLSPLNRLLGLRFIPFRLLNCRVSLTHLLYSHRRDS
jgi:hypothetical protein